MENRVNWTVAEYHKLIARIVKVHPQYAADRTFAGLTSAQFVSIMNDVLPKSRRRAVIKMNKIRPRLCAAAALLDENPDAPRDRMLIASRSPQWTDEDMDAVVERLCFIKPELMNDPALSGLTISLARLAVKVLPEDRRRLFGSASIARAALAPGFARLRERPALLHVDAAETRDAAPAAHADESAPALSHDARLPRDDAHAGRYLVRWTDDEVDAMVDYMVERMPQLAHDETLGLLTFRFLSEAMHRTLPPHRCRPVKAISQVKATFMSGFARLRLRTQTPGEPAVAPLVTASPVVTHEHEHEHAHDDAPHRIFTTAAEWVLIAEKMHEQNPFYGYPYKEHLAGLSADEIRTAMRDALPVNRRRKTINVGKCREHLLAAFRIVRARLDAEKAQAEAAVEMRRAEELLRERIETPPAPVVAPAATENAPALEMLPRLIDAVAPFMAALGEQFGRSMGAALVPMLENAIINCLAAAAPVVMPAPQSASIPSAPAAPAPATRAANDERDAVPEGGERPEDLQPPTHYNGPEGIKPRPPKIAIIGPQSSLGRELEHTFPHLDFVYIEHGPKGVREAVASCERIVAVTNFLNEATRKAIKASEEGKSKFMQIDGGISSVKRALSILINAGDLRIAAH